MLDALCAPVDAASLAVFRIAFGAILLCEVVRYFSHGWIQRCAHALEASQAWRSAE